MIHGFGRRGDNLAIRPMVNNNLLNLFAEGKVPIHVRGLLDPRGGGHAIAALDRGGVLDAVENQLTTTVARVRSRVVLFASGRFRPRLVRVPRHASLALTILFDYIGGTRCRARCQLLLDSSSMLPVEVRAVTQSFTRDGLRALRGGVHLRFRA